MELGPRKAPIEPNAGYPLPLIRKYKREHHFFLINLFTKSETAEVLGAVHGQGPGELCTWDRKQGERVLLNKKNNGSYNHPPSPIKKTQK